MSSDYGDFCREQRKRKQDAKFRSSLRFIDKKLPIILELCEELELETKTVGAGTRIYKAGSKDFIDFWDSGTWMRKGHSSHFIFEDLLKEIKNFAMED